VIGLDTWTVRSQDISVSTVTGLLAGCPRNYSSVPSRCRSFISSSKSKGQLWGTHIFMFSRYWSLFPRQKSGWGARLTTSSHLVPRFRIGGGIPPLPRMHSWHTVEELYVDHNIKCMFFQGFLGNNKYCVRCKSCIQGIFYLAMHTVI
jgi:hypothetical protein